jgi:hypothetical protein
MNYSVFLWSSLEEIDESKKLMKQIIKNNMSTEQPQISSTFTEDLENEHVLISENQFDRLIEVLTYIDSVRDRIQDLANGKHGEVTMFKLSYELGAYQADLSRAYRILDSVTDELNPAHAMDSEQEDDHQ